MWDGVGWGGWDGFFDASTIGSSYGYSSGKGIRLEARARVERLRI